MVEHPAAVLTAVPCRSDGREHRSVKITVPIVRVMQVSVDQIIDMVAVRHGRMATRRGMHVSGLVSTAAMARGAVGRIRGGHVDDVFDDGAVRLVMEVPVVQIVGVSVVLDGGVTAAGAVDVIGLGMDGRCHGDS